MLKTIPIIAYILWAHLLKATHGHLYLSELIGFTVVLGALTWFGLKQPQMTGSGFKWIYLAFSFMMLSSTELIYAEDSFWTTLFELLADAQIVFPVLYWFWNWRQQTQHLNKVVWCSAGVSMVMLGLVPLVTPIPHIDVYYVLDGATEYLLQGINPYNAEYPDIYGGALGYTPDFVYWPGLLYPAILMKLLHWDVRYTHVFSLMATVLLFCRFYPQYARFSALWLMMPIGFFVLEQTWLDTLMLPYVLLLIVGIKRQSLPMTAISLGYLAASRQTNLVLFAIILAYLWKNRAFLFKVCFWAALVAIALFAPFWLWNFPAFIETTVLQVLQYRPSWDSLSWASWLLANYQIVLPANLLLLITLGLGVFSGYRARTIERLMLSILIIHLFFLLTLKQAYCNYYYYVSFYLFLYLSQQDIRDRALARTPPLESTVST